jgi:NADPH:quinone reductase-like Zn-dependent oxidoreductase
MLAITIPNFGGPEALTPAIVPDPVPAQGELLIEVQAAGVARADTLQRQGKYPPPPGASEIPGLDVAGTVLAIGEGVRGWKLGDRVCAILAVAVMPNDVQFPLSKFFRYPRTGHLSRQQLCRRIC